MTNLNRIQNTNLVRKNLLGSLSLIYFLFPENVSTVQVNRARGRVKYNECAIITVTAETGLFGTSGKNRP